MPLHNPVTKSFVLPRADLDALRTVADQRGTNLSIELRRAVRTLTASEDV